MGNVDNTQFDVEVHSPCTIFVGNFLLFLADHFKLALVLLHLDETGFYSEVGSGLACVSSMNIVHASGTK